MGLEVNMAEKPIPAIWVADRADFRTRNYETVLSEWIACLTMRWGTGADKLRELRQDIQNRSDLFSTLIETLRNRQSTELPFDEFLTKVRTPAYSIVDIFTETTLLQASIHKSLRLEASGAKTWALDATDVLAGRVNRLVRND